MKTALIFLACLAVASAQFWTPLQPCIDHDACPNGYCCRSNEHLLGIPVCEIRGQEGWPCDPQVVKSCPCADGLICVLKDFPNDASDGLCAKEVEPTGATA